MNNTDRKLHIDVWFDFVCPACYLAKPRLTEAIAASGHADDVAITWHSFELFREAKSEPFDSFEHVLHKFGGNRAQAERLEQRMASLAQEQGQPYAVHHPIANALDAHRVLHLAAEHGVADAFAEKVSLDLLGHGQNVYASKYLATAATSVGVPRDRVVAVLASDEYAAAVRADEQRARELGINAVPFMVLGGRLAVPGVADVADYKRAVAQAWSTP
jgi:predicted DsbA family dithiol-disulfide isomerase